MGGLVGGSVVFKRKVEEGAADTKPAKKVAPFLNPPKWVLTRLKGFKPAKRLRPGALFDLSLFQGPLPRETGTT